MQMILIAPFLIKTLLLIALQNDINWSIARWANVTDLIQKSQFQSKVSFISSAYYLQNFPILLVEKAKYRVYLLTNI